MTNTETLKLIKVEGKDLFNPLTQFNPNWDTIDEAFKLSGQMVVSPATHNKTGNLHAIVEQVQTSPVFRFTATGDYRTGDGFTVNGQTVTARMPDGTSLPDYAFRINSNLLAVQSGGVLTIFTNGVAADVEGFMKTADYVGVSATGIVHRAEVADSATNATNATNASALNGNPATYFAPAIQLQPMIQNVTAIQVVTELPTNPVATTLYLVKEA